MNIIVGTFQDDILSGTVDNDKMFGLKGNDRLFGGSGHDFIFGQRDNDYLAGDFSAFANGNGDDFPGGLPIRIIDDGNKLFFGRDVFGRDILYGSSGSDEIYGDIDFLVMGFGESEDVSNNWLKVHFNADVIFSGFGDRENIYGDAGHMNSIVSGENNRIKIRADDDYLKSQGDVIRLIGDFDDVQSHLGNTLNTQTNNNRLAYIGGDDKLRAVLTQEGTVTAVGDAGSMSMDTGNLPVISIEHNVLVHRAGNDDIQVTGMGEALLVGDYQVIRINPIGEDANIKVVYGNDTIHLQAASFSSPMTWGNFIKSLCTPIEAPTQLSAKIYGDVETNMVLIAGEGTQFSYRFGKDTIILEDAYSPVWRGDTQLASTANNHAVIYGDSGGITTISIDGVEHQIKLLDAHDVILAESGEQIMIADSVYALDELSNNVLLESEVNIQRGNDVMAGGDDQDTFVFHFLQYTDRNGDHMVGIGKDVIKDFELNDLPTTGADEGDILFFMLPDPDNNGADNDDLKDIIDTVQVKHENTVVKFIDGSRLTLIDVDEQSWDGDKDAFVDGLQARGQLEVTADLVDFS